MTLMEIHVGEWQDAHRTIEAYKAQSASLAADNARLKKTVEKQVNEIERLKNELAAAKEDLDDWRDNYGDSC